MSVSVVVKALKKEVATAAGTLDILKGIDFEIKPQQTVAIVGASGSGKSTLLGILAGLDLPTSGQVYLDDVDVCSLDEDGRALLRAAKIGFVFQSFQLLPGLTALENVMLPLEIANAVNALSEAKTFLERVGLAERADHYPKQLSGGEQQRVAIARAFAARPGLLFADEPTGNLDTGTGARVSDLLFELNAETGTTLVLVTHDNQLAARCDRRLQMDSGRLHEDRA